MSQRSVEALINFGFFGKLPINGDFIQRNLPNHFVHCWDNWLQENLLACQQKYPGDWLQHYLTSPIWRFFIAPSVIDENAYIGIVGPSVDTVGRYFPITMVTPIPRAHVAAIFSSPFQKTFVALEAIFLKYLHMNSAQTHNAVDLLCEDLRVQSRALESLIAQQSIERLPESLDSHRFILSDQRDMAGAVSSLWLMQIMERHKETTLWWSNGNQSSSPSFLSSRSLPDKQQFVEMFSSFNDSNHWREKQLTLAIEIPEPVAVESLKPATLITETPARDAPVNQLVADFVTANPSQIPQSAIENHENTDSLLTSEEYHDDDQDSLLLIDREDASSLLLDASLDEHSADEVDQVLTLSTDFAHIASGFTDVGHLRKENQDAILIHHSDSLWVVADGMGGHSDGDKASKSIVSQLNELKLQGDLFANINQVKAVLNQVNRDILDYANERHTTCGSTVVALLRNQDQCSFLWAGDSRLYLRRGHELIQLTSDHSVENSFGMANSSEPRPKNHAITRAVGVFDELDVECGFHELAKGDRFLLCSDGLYGPLAESQINQGLACDTPDQAAALHQKMVLAGEARDNLSGVYIWF
ncbi:MAG: type VI secretion system ImpM family protein [Oleiphilaceae bacterium]|jgi:type VI secretion system ImpM family protein